MKRSKSSLSLSSKSGQSFGARLESLEDRQFMSGDAAAVISRARLQFSATVSAIVARIENAFDGASSSSSSSSSAKAGTKKSDPPPKTTDEAIARLRTDAELLSSSKAALGQALKQLVQAEPAAGYEAGKRILIAENLSLPSDALKTKLSSTELIEHVTELQAAGGQDEQSTAAYWQTVSAKGADAALAGVVAGKLGIPAAAVVGKKAHEIVDDSGNINLMGGDVRSLKAWQGLGLLKAGTISPEQYAKDYTDASDVGKGAGSTAGSSTQPTAPPATAAKDLKDAVGATGVTQRVTGGSVGSNASSGTATTGATTGNVNVGSTNAAAGSATSVQTSPPAGTGEAAATTQPPVTNSPPATNNNASSASDNAANSDPGGRVVGTISNVHNEGGTSTYTLTKTYSNGASTTVHVTVYPDGSADVVSENGGVEHYDAGTTDPMPDSGEGQTIVLSGDDDGDGYADSGTYYPPSEGSGDGSDDGGDDDDDDNNDNGDGANTDTAPAPADSQGDGTGGDTAPAASGEPTPDTDTSNPQKKNDFYQNNPIGRSVAGSMSPTSGPTGGAGDPEDAGTNPAARQKFESSPLGSKGKGVRVPGGAIDYPDGERPTSIVVDARQLQAIAIRAGGAVGGPEAGKPVTVPGGNTGNGVIPTTPVKGGGGTTSASGASTSATVGTASSVATFSTVRVSASVSGISSAAITAKVSTAVFAK